MTQFCDQQRLGIRCHHFLAWMLLCLFFPMVAVGRSQAAVPDSQIDYLKSLSIEDLLDTEVTSVSKRSEQLLDAASAVFVITQEDIKRTGAKSIPEALRMVPGLQVARIDANKWAVSSRGFNDRFSNKLLVLMDGRSVYSPLFSGVHWDVQDTLLEDVDRIEVIRGPGATLWGANAVNGVINIITKPARETQGGLVSVGAGTYEKATGEARYGGRIADDTFFRLYAKGFDNGDFETATGEPANDAWNQVRSGFRLDSKLNDRDDITIQGDIYQGNENETITLADFMDASISRTIDSEVDLNGGNILTRWHQQTSEASDFDLQIYYDHSYREGGFLRDYQDTIDIDWHQRWQAIPRHEVVWGLGYRFTRDDTIGTMTTSFDPEDRQESLFSAFIQDDVMLMIDRLWLTLGSKFEHNDHSGFEVQPSARLRWKPIHNHTLWTAVSRAVRTPSRSDVDVTANISSSYDPYGNVVVRVLGDDDFESEEMTAYEAGYRWESTRSLSLDVAAFYNVYENLRTVEMGNPFFEFSPEPPHMVLPLSIDNKMDADTYGMEALATWQPLGYWRLSVGYGWLNIQVHPDQGSTDPYADDYDGHDPRQQVQVRSYLDLPLNLSLDTELYYVDSLPSFAIPSYTRLDLRLGWEPSERWSVSLNAENLLDGSHPEFDDLTVAHASEVPRAFYGKVTWRF